MAATLHTSLKEKICESVEIPVLTRCCFCFPLRKGLISFAYINLVLTLVVASFLSLYMAQLRSSTSTAPTEAYQAPDASHGAASPPEVNLHSDAVEASEAAEFPRLVADTVGLLLELVMTVSFIVALHKKHVLLMKVYLYFEIVFSVIGFAYSLAFMTRETASELFLILFQLTIQIYLVILIWSSIVKMERDGSVKYVRDREGV